MGVDIIDNRRKRINVESMVAFDGVSQYASAGVNQNIVDAVNTDRDWSFSDIFNHFGTRSRLFSNRLNRDSAGMHIQVTGSRTDLRFFYGGYWRWFYSEDKVPTGLVHLVINYNSNTATASFFCNSGFIGSSTDNISWSPGHGAEPMVWGYENYQTRYGAHYDAHKCFFNRTLTETEIRSIHRNGGIIPESTHAACVAHYPMTHREGNTLFDVVEQYNYAKVTPLVPYHATLQNFTAAQHTGDNQSAYKDFYTKTDLRPYVDSDSDGTPDSPLIEKKSGLPPLLKALKIESSSSQSVTLGNVGAIEGVRIATKLEAINQSILSLDNTAATTIDVSAGVVTVGASITNLQIYVDGVAHNATDAGAILNDLKLHDVVFLFDSIAASDMRITSADKHVAALFVATDKPSRKQIIELANNTLLAQPKTNQQADISQLYNFNEIIDNAGTYELSNELGAGNAVLNNYTAANFDDTDPAYSLTDIDSLR